MNRKSIKLAVYGGAFDPPHIGHADAMRQACALAERVLVVPSFCHPSGKVMASFQDRCRMTEHVISTLREEGMDIGLSRDEEALFAKIDGPIYSLLLLRHIAGKEGLDSSDIALVVGEDNLRNLYAFWNVTDIINEFRILVVKEQELIHSSQIRAKVKLNQDVSNYLLGNKTIEAVYALYGNQSGEQCYGK